MEEKEIKIGNSIRSIFNNWHPAFSLFQARNRKNHKSGFTLVELIVTIAIVGLISSAFIVLINPSQQLRRSRDSDRKSDLKLIQSALELHRSDLGAYPAPVSNTINNCSGTFEGLDSASPNCADTDNPVYLQSIPTDPKTTSLHYYYCTSTSAPCSAPSNGYAIFACIENASETVGGEVLGTNPSTISCPTGTTRWYKVINP